MLQKLKRYGAEDGTLLWFTDYLSEGFGNCCLITAQVTSEVSQGTLLGPVLFVIFIEKLLRVHEEKDLGVVISDKLT